jgi:hypothetical protein
MRTVLVALFLAMTSSLASASRHVCDMRPGEFTEFVSCSLRACQEAPAAERQACIQERCGAEFDALSADCQVCVREVGTQYDGDVENIVHYCALSE